VEGLGQVTPPLELTLVTISLPASVTESEGGRGGGLRAGNSFLRTYLGYHPGFRIRIDLMRIQIRIRIQHFFLLRIRIPDPDPGFDDLKLKKIYN
jgi:hypothetical protein